MLRMDVSEDGHVTVFERADDEWTLVAEAGPKQGISARGAALKYVVDPINFEMALEEASGALFSAMDWRAR